MHEKLTVRKNTNNDHKVKKNCNEIDISNLLFLT